MNEPKEMSKLEEALRRHVEYLGMQINKLADEAAEIETESTALINTRQKLIDILAENGDAQ